MRFQCVAASIEAAAEHWFTSGPLVDAVLASAAVPGILPPVEVGGEHFIDGGIVNSIPVDRAVALGATRIFVMHVGRVDRPLEPPRWPWEVGLVAFEIARRHRFLGDLASLPDGRGPRDADRASPSRRSTTTSRRCATASSAGRRREHRARPRRLASPTWRSTACEPRAAAAVPARHRRAARARASSSRCSSPRPLLTAIAALLSPLFGGRRPLRVLTLVLAYAAGHVAAVGGLRAALGGGRARAHGAALRGAALVRRRRWRARRCGSRACA